MKRFVVCLVGLLAMVGTALASAADIYQMSMVVTQAGVVISKPMIQLEGNKDVTLTVTPGSTSGEGAIRLQVNVAQAKQDPANVVTVHMLVFDKVGNEWTLRSEPTLKAAMGTQSTLTLDTKGITRPALPIGVSFQVQKVTEENASMLDSQFPSLRQMALAPPVTPAVQPQCGCCNAGSLHCCGVVSCCETLTGVCCTPKPCTATIDRHLKQENFFRSGEEDIIMATTQKNGESNINRYYHLKASPTNTHSRNGVGNDGRGPTITRTAYVLVT